jgi:hypothetical protein
MLFNTDSGAGGRAPEPPILPLAISALSSDKLGGLGKFWIFAWSSCKHNWVNEATVCADFEQ